MPDSSQFIIQAGRKNKDFDLDFFVFGVWVIYVTDEASDLSGYFEEVALFAALD